LQKKLLKIVNDVGNKTFPMDDKDINMIPTNSLNSRTKKLMLNLLSASPLKVMTPNTN